MDQGKLTIMPSSTSRLSYIVWKLESLHAGTCRTGTGMSAYRSGLLLPPGLKIIMGSRLFTDYKILTVFTGITDDTDVQIV